jgi:aspartyl-tRNA(Asn)/glutamyl-tRNA(Gln) amidotransferase subunit C
MKIDLDNLARLARLELSPEERETFAPQLTKILDHMHALDAIDVSGVSPTAHAAELFDVLRADAPRPGLSQQQALQNAPAASNGMFRVTQVVE